MKISLKIKPDAEYMEIIRESPITLEALVKEYESQLPYRILIAKVNGMEEELAFTLQEDSQVEFLDMRRNSAYLVYQRTVSLVYLKAVRDVMGDVIVEIGNSLNKGLYTIINTAEPVTEQQVKEI